VSCDRRFVHRVHRRPRGAWWASVALALRIALQASGASAGAVLDVPIVVNTYTTGTQGRPAVSAHDDGSFVIVWESRGQDGDYYGVFGQRFDGGGTRLGDEFLVNTYTVGPQFFPTVVALASGGFVVAWQGYGLGGDYGDIFARRYDDQGAPTGSAFQVNDPVPTYEAAPAVAALSNGDFVIVWDDYDNVLARRYDSGGTQLGSPFAVNTYTPGSQINASVAATSDGGFVIAWADGYNLSNGLDGSGYGVFARRFDAGGAPRGDAFQVSAATLGDQYAPAVAATIDGGFAVTWASSGDSGGTATVYARRFDANGVAAGGDLQVNAETTGLAQAPRIAADSLGGFVVVWTDAEAPPSLSSTVRARRFDADGVPRGDELPLQDNPDPVQLEPAVAGLPGGEFVAAWRDDGADGANPDVVARRAGGVPGAPTHTPTATPLSTNTATPSVTQSRAPTGTAAVPACAGDCNGNGQVTVDDLVLAVNIALGSQPVARCAAVDRDGNGVVSVAELVTAVTRALNGC